MRLPCFTACHICATNISKVWHLNIQRRNAHCLSCFSAFAYNKNKNYCMLLHSYTSNVGKIWAFKSNINISLTCTTNKFSTKPTALLNWCLHTNFLGYFHSTLTCQLHLIHSCTFVICYFFLLFKHSRPYTANLLVICVKFLIIQCRASSNNTY